jgi:SAM-dependent methyltransferase
MQSEQFQLHADIEQRHWWFVGRRRIMRRLIGEVLPPSPETTIIDVGCGTGANISHLANDYRTIGIDTSAEAITRARPRFPQVHFLEGRAPADLGALMPQARLVMLMDVLEHVSDDFALLSELLAAATPGTYLLLTVPADESLWSQHDESFGHYRRYDLARLEQVWAGLPVTTLLLSYFNARLLPLIRIARARSRRRGHAAGQVGTDFWLPSPPINRILQIIFAGESRRLVRLLNGRCRQGYAAGSSLVALVRREAGPLAIRSKPAGLPPDHCLAAK